MVFDLVLVLVAPVGLAGSVCTVVLVVLALADGIEVAVSLEVELDIGGVVVVVVLLLEVVGGDVASGWLVVVLVVVEVDAGGWAIAIAGTRAIVAAHKVMRMSLSITIDESSRAANAPGA